MLRKLIEKYSKSPPKVAVKSGKSADVSFIISNLSGIFLPSPAQNLKYPAFSAKTPFAISQTKGGCAATMFLLNFNHPAGLMKKSRLVGALLAAAALFLTAADVPPSEDRLWEHRNLGKAFYENPDTHVQAVTELREALRLNPDSVRDRINYGLALLRAGQTDEGVAELLKSQKQDPSNPHTWFNLGIAYKHAGDYDKAIEQLQGMIKLVPNEAVAHYNLASVLRSKGDAEAALPEFQEAERLNPNLAGPHFQLFSLYQRAQNRADAAKERQEFEDIKKRTEGAPVPEDMEWCFYVELDDPPEARSTAAAEPTRYDDKTVSTGWSAALICSHRYRGPR